jgi:hypothetical protein
MATYTYQQLYGNGIPGEDLSGTKTFNFYNIVTGSISTPYLWNTTPENWNEYILNWDEEDNSPVIVAVDGISSYFTMETVRNEQGFYNSTSPLNFEGTYNVTETMGLVTSSYIASVVVQPGFSSFTFTPNVFIPGVTYRLRGTGMYSLEII